MFVKKKKKKYIYIYINYIYYIHFKKKTTTPTNNTDLSLLNQLPPDQQSQCNFLVINLQDKQGPYCIGNQISVDGVPFGCNLGYRSRLFPSLSASEESPLPSLRSLQPSVFPTRIFLTVQCSKTATQSYQSFLKKNKIYQTEGLWEKENIFKRHN